MIIETFISQLLILKIQAIKLFIVYYIMFIMNLVMLDISDSGWLALGIIFPSFFSLCGLVFVALINKKVNSVASKVNGITTELIKTKTTEAHAIGMKDATDAIGKETAAKNLGELNAIKEDVLRKTPPPK